MSNLPPAPAGNNLVYKGSPQSPRGRGAYNSIRGSPPTRGVRGSSPYSVRGGTPSVRGNSSPGIYSSAKNLPVTSKPRGGHGNPPNTYSSAKNMPVVSKDNPRLANIKSIGASTSTPDVRREHAPNPRRSARIMDTPVVASDKSGSMPNLSSSYSSAWYKNWIVDWESEEEVSSSEDEEKPSEDEKTSDPSSVGDGALTRIAKRKLGDVYKLVEVYCSDWEDSPLDIAAFCFCLAAFNDTERVKKQIIFDEQLILTGYHYGQYAFAAYKGPKLKRVFKRLPFLPEEDFVTGNWNKEELKAAPAWYCAIDHDEKAVILALRGTKEREDILVDLAAQYVPWNGGYAHQGFVRSLTQLEPFVLDVIKAQMSAHPQYRLRIVGHSMGAAVSALLVLKWVQEYPQWQVYGYGYATPCCISGHLLQKSKSCFTTFVHHYDAVSRLSLGSVQDLHNGMRLFVDRVGKNQNIRAILHALGKITLNAASKKIISTASEVNQIIQQNLETELRQSETTAHLFPAGITYQLWRERRGKHFKTWDLYQSDTHFYGRLQFSPTMLKDHGSGGYNAAFENLLAISIVERTLWLSMKPSKREQIRVYWDSFPDVDPMSPDYNPKFAIEQMQKKTKYSRKAFEQGIIRPFLMLVSMSPKRRAALANMMGIHLIKQGWYGDFNPHREAWHMLRSHRKGLQARSNSSARTMNPLAESSNWYMILHTCVKRVKKAQSSSLPAELKQLLKKRGRSWGDSISMCRNSKNHALPAYEEVAMLVFFHLVDPERKDKQQQQKEKSFRETRVFLTVPEAQEVIKKFRALGFTTEDFLALIAQQYVERSTNKKANEMYSWGDVIRHKDEKIKKKEVAGVAGLTLLGGALLVSAVPMIMVAPPIALIPIGLGIGVGAVAATKATPGGLVSIVVGCLQQRLALAFKGVTIEQFY